MIRRPAPSISPFTRRPHFGIHSWEKAPVLITAAPKSPTRKILEEAVAELEGGDRAFACSSGMAALQTVFSLFSQGDHLLVSLDLYGGTYRLIEQVLSRFGITASYVDTNDLEELERHRTSATKAVLIETPTNPLMMITDLEKVCTWAKKHGLLAIVDNTLLTPYFQRPIEWGADIVIHSATKYLGGHNDVLAGLIIAKGEELAERLFFLHNSIGAVLAPHDCYLLMRGMKTLALRMERHQQNAIKIAEYLKTHPMVEQVYYPYFPSHPGHDVHHKQSSGNTGIFSFRMKSAETIPAYSQTYPSDRLCGKPGRCRVADDFPFRANPCGYSGRNPAPDRSR